MSSAEPSGLLRPKSPNKNPQEGLLGPGSPVMAASGSVDLEKSEMLSTSALGPSTAPRVLAKPKLHREEAVIHAPFLKVCCDQLDPRTKDWNEMFQVLWEVECRPIYVPENRLKLQELLAAFDSHAMELAQAVVEAQTPSIPQNEELRKSIKPVRGFSNCFRYGNIFLRLWPESRLPTNLMKCYAAVFQARVPNLFFPLTSLNAYCGYYVTAQALIPILKDVGKVYRLDGMPDVPRVRPAHDFTRRLAEALNVELIDAGRRQLKIFGVEVIDGTDSRYYITNPCGLVPPLLDTPDVPVKRRYEFMTACSDPLRYAGSELGSFKSNVDTLMDLLTQFLQQASFASAKDIERQQKLVELMHYCGLNLCLLGLALAASAELTSDPRDTARTQSTIGVEIIARATKNALSKTLVQTKAPATVETINRFLLRTLGGIMDKEHDRFSTVLLPMIVEKYHVSGDNKEIVSILHRVLNEDRVLIAKRLCYLCGFALNKGTIEALNVVTSDLNFSTVLGTIITAEHVGALLDEEEDDSRSEEYLVSSVLPQRAALYGRRGDFSNALTCARQVMSARCNFNKKSFLYFDSMIDTAMLLQQVNDFTAAENLLTRAFGVFTTTSLFAEDHEVNFALRGQVLVFHRGRIIVQCLLGQLWLEQNRVAEAKKAFFEALDITKKLRDGGSGHVYLLPLHGILDTAVRGGDAIQINLNSFYTTCSTMVMRMIPSKEIYEILDKLGALLLEKSLFPQAAECLRDAEFVCRVVYGPTSAQLATALNSLAFVYYTWDVKQYGTHCEEIMRESLEITALLKGHTLDHLCALNNLGNLLLAQKRFAAASKVFNEALEMPKTRRDVPPDHPILQTMQHSMNLLRMKFRAFAVVRMQQYWRRYLKRRKQMNEIGAALFLIQRVGRGFLFRQADGLQRAFVMPTDNAAVTIRIMSMGLIAASATIDQSARDWNGEFQHLVEMPKLTAEHLAARSQEIEKLIAEFTEAALVVKDTRERYTGSVPGCENSFRCGNIVVTKAPDYEHALVQQSAFREILVSRIPILHIPLTVILDDDLEPFVAQAVLPLTRDVLVVYRDDGKEDKIFHGAVHGAMRLLLKHVGITSPSVFGEQHKQRGVQVAEGADGRFYVTNAVGLFHRRLAMLAQSVRRGPSMALSGQMTQNFTSSVDDETLIFYEPKKDEEAVGLYQQVAFYCRHSRADEAVAAAEESVMEIGASHGKHSFEYVFALALLAEVYSASPTLLSSAPRHRRKVAEIMNALCGESALSIIAFCQLGDSLLRYSVASQAVTAFSTALDMVMSIRPHPVYGAELSLMPYRGLLRCWKAGERSVQLVSEKKPMLRIIRQCWPNSSVVDMVSEYGTALMHSKAYEDAFEVLQDAARLAKVVFGERTVAYAKALNAAAFVLFLWNPLVHGAQCRALMEEALEVLTVIEPDGQQMASLANNLGCLLLKTKQFGAAREYFGQAKEIFRRLALLGDVDRVSRNEQTMQNKIRVGAIIRIQIRFRTLIKKNREKRGRDLTPQEKELFDTERTARWDIYKQFQDGALLLFVKAGLESVESAEKRARLKVIQKQLEGIDTLRRKNAIDWAKAQKLEAMRATLILEKRERKERMLFATEFGLVAHKAYLGRRKILEAHERRLLIHSSLWERSMILRWKTEFEAQKAFICIEEQCLRERMSYHMTNILHHDFFAMHEESRSMIQKEAFRTKYAIGDQFAESANAVKKIEQMDPEERWKMRMLHATGETQELEWRQRDAVAELETALRNALSVSYRQELHMLNDEVEHRAEMIACESSERISHAKSYFAEASEILQAAIRKERDKEMCVTFTVPTLNVALHAAVKTEYEEEDEDSELAPVKIMVSTVPGRTDASSAFAASQRFLRDHHILSKILLAEAEVEMLLGDGGELALEEEAKWEEMANFFEEGWAVAAISAASRMDAEQTPARQRQTTVKSAATPGRVTLSLLLSQEMDGRNTVIMQEKSHFAHVVSLLNRYSAIKARTAVQHRRIAEAQRQELEFHRVQMCADEEQARKQISDSAAYEFSQLHRTQRAHRAKVLKRQNARTTLKAKEKTVTLPQMGAEKAKKEKTAASFPSPRTPSAAKTGSEFLRASRLDNITTDAQFDEGTLLPMMQGFVCDNLMCAVLEYEVKLQYLKADLMAQRQELTQELAQTIDEKTIAEGGSNTRWIPARPSSAHAIDFVSKGERVASAMSAARSAKEASLKSTANKEQGWQSGTGHGRDSAAVAHVPLEQSTAGDLNAYVQWAEQARAHHQQAMHRYTQHVSTKNKIPQLH